MPELSPKRKRQARITALQAIYAIEMEGSRPEETFREMMQTTAQVPEKVKLYGKHLCSITLKNITAVDLLIKERLKNWDLDRLTLMDKLILRVSISEMLFEDSVPPKVSITEGVEIAKQFSTPDSSSFINGVLDSVYNEKIKGKEKTV
jgi:N utilization substance protein B